MKRILATAVALSALAAASQAQAADFILSGNSANPLYGNFNLDPSSTPADTLAFLKNTPGAISFTDHFFFAPFLASIGGGAAIANFNTQLSFNVPNGLTITGYDLALSGLQDELEDAFIAGAGGYGAELTAIQNYLATNPAQTYFKAGVGDTQQQQLTNVSLNSSNFYVITISGKGTKSTSGYSGNLSSTAVPEPGTWAMMLVGFGAVGFAMRRRRKEQPKVRFAF
jgi:hypothetical protein